VNGLKRPEGEITNKQQQIGSVFGLFGGGFNAAQILAKLLYFLLAENRVQKELLIKCFSQVF
jgi:hypothetical protein